MSTLGKVVVGLVVLGAVGYAAWKSNETPRPLAAKRRRISDGSEVQESGGEATEPATT
jgi:hypothetical protein